MNEVVSFPLTPDVVRQRRRTVEVLDAWGLKAIYAHPGTKRPLTKITDTTVAKVQPADWFQGAAANYNLLGILPRDMVDLDLDIRVKEHLETRAPDWGEEERATVELELLAPFREAFRETLGAFDFRALFGRQSLGGQGHLLIRVGTSEEVTIEERRMRLSQLQFSLDLGHFTVKLEVRQPTRKADSKVHCFLPGSIYPDGELCAFRSLPDGPVSMASNALETYPLEAVAKAVYRFALVAACQPLLGEGERHTTALLVSGVLRREVEQTERDGGAFTRDDAETVFRAIFAGDPELHDRMHVFAQDFARTDTSDMPGYPALGERIGPRTADAMRLMLHGRDMGMFDEMRANIVFVRARGTQCVDLSQRTGTTPLALFEHAGLKNNYSHYKVRMGRREVPAFDILRTSKGRRQTDDVIALPGYPRGAELFQSGGGELLLERNSDSDQHLINIASGWATPYEEDETLPRAAARKALETMCTWLSPRPEDWKKLLQMWAFKIQNPLVKPQFALGVYGGQGIGKNFVLGYMPRAILGLSVKETSAEDLFGKDFSLNAAIGASFIVVDEVKDLVNHSLAKGLARSEWHEINVKFQGKNQHRIFAVPIYLTNEAHPQFNVAGDIDRTLYIIRAPNQMSLGLSKVGWQEFVMQRKQEVLAQIDWLDDIRNRMAVMAVLTEYPVTQDDLEDITTSDSLTGEFLADDMSAEQLALRIMLEQNMVHPKAVGRFLSMPFDKQAFDNGFNHFYMQYSGRGAKPLSNVRITRILKECLGDYGKLADHRPNDGKRIYWFPAKLGTLCNAFDTTVGGLIERDTPAHQELGEWTPDAAELRNAIASWSRVDTGSDY
jgi:hypothetical protein